MKIAIIETGLPPEDIRADFISYPEMFKQLIGLATQDVEFETFSFCHHEFMPNDIPDIKAYNGFLITGSPAGVYEDWPWMQPLFTFIQEAAKANKPLIGVCFGHQAIAQALGGEVIKSPKGWGIGRHHYNFVHKPEWMNTDAESFSLSVSHQDQVVALPANAQLIALSDFCELAAVYYPDAPALTFQGHPEFSDEYAAALYNIRRGTKFDSDMVDEALISLKDTKEDNANVAQWMWAFLQAKAN